MSDAKPAIQFPPKMTWSLVGRLLLIGIPFFAIIGGTFFILQSFGPEGLQKLIADAGPLAPVVYITIRVLSNVFAPLSSGPLQISSGVGFGLWWGVFYSLIGEVVGGSIAFLISRYLGRPIVRHFVGVESMDQVDRFSRNMGGWKALVYARLFLFSVYDFISYGAGLTQIRFVTYVLVSTVVGIIPTFLIVAFGAKFTSNGFTLLLAYGIAAVVPIVFALIRKPLTRWLGINPEIQPEVET